MAAAIAMTRLASDATPKKMGVKRMYAHLGDGAMFADTAPRKRARYRGNTIQKPQPTPTVTPRRILRVRRTPVRMEVVPEVKKRPANASTPPSKRVRRAPEKSGACTPLERVFYTAEMRAAEARKMPRKRAPTPTRPVEEEIEIEAEGAGSVPLRTFEPPPPAVHAAMLEDGRVAVRIVRDNGMMQAVVIDPPNWY